MNWTFSLYLVAFLLTVSVYGLVRVDTKYHEHFGIPNAGRIKEFEDAFFVKGLELNSNENSSEFRIIGGNVAPRNAYPYLGGLLISLVNNPSTSVCGSSLISDTRLVTAAHCWYDGDQLAGEFEVVLGSQYLYYGGDRYKTSNVIMHPNWFPKVLQNDIAIGFFPRRVLISQFVQPVNLPHNNLWDTFAGKWAIAAGYGFTSDEQSYVSSESIVSQVNLLVITDEECMQTYGPTFGTICTDGHGPVGICNGDSGGPLVININGQDTLIGITSFKFIKGCELGLPSAFTRVTAFYDFIMQNM